MIILNLKNKILVSLLRKISHIIPQLWYANTVIGVFRIPKNSMNFANELMDI